MLVKGNKAAGVLLNQVLKFKHISWNAKLQIYKTIVGPTATFVDVKYGIYAYLKKD